MGQSSNVPYISMRVSCVTGGLFLRAVAETCQHTGPQMKTLVTLGSPHQGILLYFASALLGILLPPVMLNTTSLNKQYCKCRDLQFSFLSSQLNALAISIVLAYQTLLPLSSSSFYKHFQSQVFVTLKYALQYCSYSSWADTQFICISLILLPFLYSIQIATSPAGYFLKIVVDMSLQVSWMFPSVMAWTPEAHGALHTGHAAQCSRF